MDLTTLFAGLAVLLVWGLFMGMGGHLIFIGCTERGFAKVFPITFGLFIILLCLTAASHAISHI